METPLTFDAYQKSSKATAIYPNIGKNFIYPVFGVSSEAGEIADIAKRIVRDKSGVFDAGDRERMIIEIGDLLWYAAQLASEFGISLEDCARQNLTKLKQRQDQGILRNHG